MKPSERTKDYFFLAIGSAIVGFACFAIQYLLFKDDYQASINSAIGVTIVSFVMGILQPYITKWSKKKKRTT